ncbi:hypothetical protein PIB30_002122 [Stylosanthes scabra]|uniref:Uncharacterized protein n=1 Tax=Stylosanthes scabra TaxID=79078 RepID=A0ABU6R4J1_9FABA|nr:hypothetical protein [Stylosanthes scabra]
MSSPHHHVETLKLPRPHQLKPSRRRRRLRHRESSLIAAAPFESFSETVPPVLPLNVLLADFCPGNVPVTVVYTASSPLTSIRDYDYVLHYNLS